MTGMSIQQVARQVAIIKEAITRGVLPDPDTQQEWLNLLSRWECWEPCLSLLALRAQKNGNNSPEDDILNARILNISLQRAHDAVAACCRMIKARGLTFEEVRIRVLPGVLLPGEARQEAMFCEKMADAFSELKDQVACLEHIAFLYDKKLHNEQALPGIYQQLLQLDPGNIRALKFFKSLHSQTHNWEEAARYLNILLKAVQWPEEKYRVAQELALVSLYQLQKPQEALYLLNQYCHGSPLDTSTVKYDALSSLKDWNGCLAVLQDCLQMLGNDSEKTAIYLRMGRLLAHHLRREQEAILSYQEASKYQPGILEPLEEELYIYMRRKDWKSLDGVLGRLRKKICNEELRAKITQMRNLLAYGLQNTTN